MCDQVEKCCFCISLRSGVITIGCILLIEDSIILAWMSNATYTTQVRWRGMWPSGPWDIIELAPFWMTVVYDALFSLAVSLDISLLVGAITGRRGLLQVWKLGYMAVYILLLLVSSLIVIVAFLFGLSFLGFSCTAGFLILAGLVLYFWTVVDSYYQQLGQQNGEGEPLSTAGKVYNTVPTGDVPPAQGANCDGEATRPPRYTSST